MAASSSGYVSALCFVFLYKKKSGDLASELGDAFLTPLNQSSKLYVFQGESLSKPEFM